MKVSVHQRFESRLPPGDDHPYRTGPWTPSLVEYDATDLDVDGELPDDLDDVYLRNTENPLLPAIGRYHPFDGDGMVHAVHFRAGRADYRNRFVRTVGLAAELEAGEPLWAGIIESPASSKRDGWGARTRMKDASSTDIVVHNGLALTTFYQCGDAYQLDPVTLADRGRASWSGRFPSDLGISAHPKLDPHTGELLFFNYGTEAPYMHYGVVSADGQLAHYVPVPLPGPRLPHDMAFTERYALLFDFSLFWDPALLARGVYRPRFFEDVPSRVAVVPRRGGPEPIRWFEISPTYVLHWINAYEDGDEIVLDGFHQACPQPRPRPDAGPWGALQQMTDTSELGTRPHRWRLDLATGSARESFLDDRFSEFPTIHPMRAGRAHRYAYAMTSPPGWFLFDGIVRFDLVGGGQERYAFPDGVFASESPVVPRAGSTAEDDGYLVTLVTDMPSDRSECWVFDASDVASGPIARLRLPARISSGTHAHWAPAAALTPAR
ncbi:MAG TPA: carotenoid oxygenase family protein [Kofleriaceae bacterium]|nr:carotenoid oxygenase family protein [Kofleriaceae bacterium]